MLRIIYSTDEAFKRRMCENYVKRVAVYILCDSCGRELRLCSLASHVICCKNKKSPELAMLKILSDNL